MHSRPGASSNVVTDDKDYDDRRLSSDMAAFQSVIDNYSDHSEMEQLQAACQSSVKANSSLMIITALLLFRNNFFLPFAELLI